MNKFVGISAFVYVMDFARWLLALKMPGAKSNFVAQFPSPSLSEMNEACEMVCKLTLMETLFSQHAFTSKREAKGRCFDVCYVSEVLSLILNEMQTDRLVHFLLEVCTRDFICIRILGARKRIGVDVRILH